MSSLYMEEDTERWTKVLSYIGNDCTDATLKLEVNL